MKLGKSAGRRVALDESSGAWVSVGGQWGHDLLQFRYVSPACRVGSACSESCRSFAEEELRTANSTAVITGAASGVDAAVALDLAARGTHLALADCDADTAEVVVGRARRLGARASVHRLDVTDTEAVSDLPNAVFGEHGCAHIPIKCAGVLLLGSFEQLTLDEFKWLLDVNRWGTVSVTRTPLSLLGSKPTAHISNMSSGVRIYRSRETIAPCDIEVRDSRIHSVPRSRVRRNRYQRQCRPSRWYQDLDCHEGRRRSGHACTYRLPGAGRHPRERNKSSSTESPSAGAEC